MKESPIENSISDKERIVSTKRNDTPKQTYRICGFISVILLSLGFILLSIFLLSKGIYDAMNSHFNINNFLGAIILFIIAGIITYFFPLYSSVTVDMQKGFVTIKKYRFLFLCNKTTKIETDKIVRAYTENNKEEGYGSNHDKSDGYDGFDLIFILNNGHKIVALEGEIDKNNERRKLDFYLRLFFQGSLDTDDNEDKGVLIQMQNFKTQYQPITE